MKIYLASNQGVIINRDIIDVIWSEKRDDIKIFCKTEDGDVYTLAVIKDDDELKIRMNQIEQILRRDDID